MIGASVRLDFRGAVRFDPRMTERRTNLAFMAIFSVVAVFFVAIVLLVAAWVFASGSGITPNALPPRPGAQQQGD